MEQPQKLAVQQCHRHCLKNDSLLVTTGEAVYIFVEAGHTDLAYSDQMYPREQNKVND